MADVFLSYKRQDRKLAQALVRVIERYFTVWWDTSISAGDVFTDTIQKELDAARCIVVLWSNQAVQSDFVKAEALQGFNRHILVSVKLEHVAPVYPFDLMQSATLFGWDGRSGHSGLVDTLKAIENTIESDRGRDTQLKAQPRITHQEVVNRGNILTHLLGEFGNSIPPEHRSFEEKVNSWYRLSQRQVDFVNEALVRQGYDWTIDHSGIEGIRPLQDQAPRSSVPVYESRKRTFDDVLGEKKSMVEPSRTEGRVVGCLPILAAAAFIATVWALVLEGDARQMLSSVFGHVDVFLRNCFEYFSG